LAPFLPAMSRQAPTDIDHGSPLQQTKRGEGVSILDLRPDEIPEPRTWIAGAVPKPSRPEKEWAHPTNEADRLIELEGFLARDFDTYREVKIVHHSYTGRIDLLAAPKIGGLRNVALAFEVKADGFDIERALKQCADYVGGRVIGTPHRNKRIAACLLYPTDQLHGDRYYSGMFNLVAQWRVGRGYVRRNGYEIVDDGEMGNRDNPLTRPAFRLELTIGLETIWDSRGWHSTVANRMLMSRRTVCGSRRGFNHVHVELNGYRRF
jgi:hypothetical protein